MSTCHPNPRPAHLERLVRECWPHLAWELHHYGDGVASTDADYAKAALRGLPLVSGLAQPVEGSMHLEVAVAGLGETGTGQELFSVTLAGGGGALVIAESYVEPGDYREAIEGGRAALLAWVQAVAVAVQGALGGAS